MVTIKMVLDEKRTKADGKSPILFRITHNRKTTNYASGISIPSQFWDNRRLIVAKGYPNSKDLNGLLYEKFTTVERHILQLERNESFTFSNFKAIYHNHEVQVVKHDTFKTFATRVIIELHSVKRVGNAIVYQTAVNRLLGFTKDDTITFEKIDYILLSNFTLHLEQSGINLTV